MGATAWSTTSPRRRKTSSPDSGGEMRAPVISRTRSDSRGGHQRPGGLDAGVIRPPSTAASPRRSRAPSNISRSDTSIGGGRTGGNGNIRSSGGMSSSARTLSTIGSPREATLAAPYSWWTTSVSRGRPAVREGWLKKRGGRINTWGDRYLILRDRTLEQYAKGEDASCAEPKHVYELDPACSLSTIKEVRASGKTLFSFQLDWPAMDNTKDEVEGGESSRSGQEDDHGDSEDPHASNGSTLGEAFSPLESPVECHARRGNGDEGGSFARQIGMNRALSNGSQHGAQMPHLGQQEARPRPPRCNSSPHNSGPVVRPKATSPNVVGRSRRECNEEETLEKRNETIENMVAAHRETETRLALLKQEELSQLTEYEQEKQRRQDMKKKGAEKKGAANGGRAVAVTAVGVSWLTAGFVTGGLVLVSGLVAAGITMGSLGAYSKFKNSRGGNGSPGRVRLASDKLDVVEQWRNDILEVLEKLRSASLEDLDDPTAWRGLSIGFPGWSAMRKATPPPALKAIDLRVVDEMLRNAAWACRDVIQGLPILEQDLLAYRAANGDTSASPADVAQRKGGRSGSTWSTGTKAEWGLGGKGPVLKTQLTVRASPLETFVALLEGPRNFMNAVVSGVYPVQSMDDHSDVIRLCLRPAWLKVAWASPRDFCLARYWHMAEDGCYIVCLSSMQHPLCAVDPAFVRGEAHIVYTISPPRDAMPDFHCSPECMLSCHIQMDPKGWVWRSFGFREQYMSHVLMHALEVRNMIEAERFLSPRMNLATGAGTDSCSLSNNDTSQDREEDNDGPFLFEVLGAPGGQEGAHALANAGGSTDAVATRRGPGRGGCRPSRGSTSLENVPPPTLNPCMWSEADGTEFVVRGESYLTTKLKVQSAKQMFRLRAVDMFVLPAPATHLASHPTNRVQIARKAGETTFVWVLQIMVPGPPHYAFVCYFTPEDKNWLDTRTPFGNLANRLFFGDDNAFRDQRLKLIPKIVEGNWVVKRAAGSTPAILGNKLKQHHFRQDNYLETDIEIGSSSVAASVTRLCTGYAKSLVVDMAWTIQGNAEEELPEVILAGVRITNLDMMSAKPFDPTADTFIEQGG